MKKFTLFLIATLFSAMSFAAVPRVMAYDLKSEMDTPAKGFTKFTFSTNTKPTKAYLIFYYAGAEVMRVDITTQAQKKLKDATYTIRTSDLPELTNMKWAIEVQGDKINSLACVNDVNNVGTYGFNRPQGVAVDNNPESDFFGRTYISLPKAGGSSSTYGAYGDTKAGIVVFDAVHNRLASGFTATGSELDDETYGVHRVAVNPVDGKVYYTKSIASNTAVYELTPDATDILKDGGTAVDVVSGLGLTRADGVCFAEDGTMFVVDYARYSGGTQGDIYKVKGNSKTLFCENIAANQPNSLAYDGKGGIWMVQQRGEAGSDPSPLVHINASGTADFKLSTNINNWFTTSNITKGGCVAYNTKDNVIAIGGYGKVMLFQVSEVDGKPTLASKIGEYVVKSGGTAEVNGLAFDYAGNLVVMSRTTERMHYLVVPTTTNSCTTPAKSSLQVNGPATCRVMPHDLTLLDNGDSYTFSYKTNVYAQSGNLVIFKEDGKTVEKTFALPTPIVKNKTHQITIAKTDLPKRLGMNWGIELAGKSVPKYSYLQEVSDQTREIYDFYNMMGVLVDNNPESDYFGKIYIQATLNGKSDGATARADAQKAGLFIYNQWLDELNPTSNVGIQPSLPSGYSIGSANQFNRLAIDPTTNNITYCYAVSGQPAVFSMDRANLTGVPTNLLAGQTGITRSVAHCFDAEGNLYVMDLPSSGQIFKIDKNGTKTTFGASNSKYVATNISLAADGRGGLWVAQNRGQIDTYYQLVHYNASGTIDFSVYQGNEHGFTGNSTRGALAYDAERQILAQGRNGSVILFDVTYNASGVPTLTQQSVTASIAHNNIDGLAFDYAGDLYVVNSGKEKFYKFTIPTNNNTCLVPAKKSLTLDYPVNYLTYELNGGQYNEYGWESKGDICLALEADYNATYGTSKDWVQEVDGEIQYNINGTWMSEEEAKGQAATVTGFLQASTYNTTDNLKKLVETTMVDKYGWLKDVIEANRTAQSVAGELSEAIYRKELSAFFLCSPAHSSWPASSSHEAMGDVAAFQSYWGQSFPNPSYTFTEVTLNNPYKEDYEFQGWYNTSDFSGAKLTTIDENTTGTLYAKWHQIVVDEEADNTTALAPYEGQLVEKVFVKRNFEPNKCYTLTLPFDMNASQIDDVFGNATVYEFYNIVEQNAEELYLEFIPTSSIQAGEPCLIVTPSGSFDANDGFMIEDVIISTTPQPVKVGAVTMMPVLDNGYLMDDPSEYYVWDGGLYCAGTYNMTSKGLRAYFVSSSPLPVRARVVLKDNEATSIPLVGVETGTQVRKIMKDGQIIIIRGEEQYNIQGQRMD
ncbi:MAG: hypothetical protein II248_02085 [Paludibacteraceae bacterium]|nr:hypothetical protein [Paludibacteraceae bacterium]